MSERSMNQSMTTMTTLHTVIMNDAICSDYNISAQCETVTSDTSNIKLCITLCNKLWCKTFSQLQKLWMHNMNITSLPWKQLVPFYPTIQINATSSLSKQLQLLVQMLQPIHWTLAIMHLGITRIRLKCGWSHGSQSSRTD